MQTTIRIVRHIRSAAGAILKSEEFGSWCVRAGDVAKREYVNRELGKVKSVEPTMGWHIETRGDETTWKDAE